MVENSMLRELSSEQLMEITDKYPWFAPARAALCRRALEAAGIDAAISAFNTASLYLPDGRFVASLLTRTEDSAFRDESLSFDNDSAFRTGPLSSDNASTNGGPVEKPRIILAGADYFSREEYESVSDDSLKNLGKIAYFNDSADEGAKDYAAAVDGTVDETGRIAITKNTTGSPSEASSNDDLVTETLALIYVEQGYNQEAAEIYRKLSLQSPEKSAYFASLIDNLKI